MIKGSKVIERRYKMREENSGKAYYFFIFLFIIFGLYDLVYQYIWIMTPFGIEQTHKIILKYFIIPGYAIYLIFGGLLSLFLLRVVRRPANVNRFNLYSILLIIIYLFNFTLNFLYWILPNNNNSLK